MFFFSLSMINDFFEQKRSKIFSVKDGGKKRVSRLYPHNIFSIVLAFKFFTNLSDMYIKLFDDDTSENDVKNDQKEGHPSSLLSFIYVKNEAKKKRFDRFFLCAVCHHQLAVACGRKFSHLQLNFQLDTIIRQQQQNCTHAAAVIEKSLDVYVFEVAVFFYVA